MSKDIKALIESGKSAVEILEAKTPEVVNEFGDKAFMIELRLMTEKFLKGHLSEMSFAQEYRKLYRRYFK